MNINLKKLEVALVLPVYKNNTFFLSVINTYCMELVKRAPEFCWTIIIVNDGSQAVPSESELFLKLSDCINYKYYHYQNNMGKGYAVRFGLSKAVVADIFIYTDYDFPFGTQAVINAVNILKQREADIVAADRGEGYLTILPFARKIITRLLRLVNTIFLKLNFKDTQAGLKGMNNRGKVFMLQTTTNGFLFDLQFIKNAEDHCLRIHPLPVDCRKHIELKNFRMNIIYSEIKNLFTLLIGKNEKNTIPSYSGSGRVRYSLGIWTNTFVESPNRNHFAGVGTPTATVNEFEN
ncbi:MAG: glycosyltransferase [Bacteroidetes bacterium]|nr:glycosyltransferase [Bacteroidota bacterium]